MTSILHRAAKPRRFLVTLAAAAVLAVTLPESASAGGNHYLLYASMHRTTGAHPRWPLVQGPDGLMYGAASGGHHRQGTIFRVDGFHHVSLVHGFPKDGTEGNDPGPLLMGSDGWIYGSTRNTDTRQGAIFRVSTSGEFQSIVTYPEGGDYGWPFGAMVLDAAGNLYFALLFSPTGFGAIVRRAPDGTTTVLHEFSGGAGGGDPYSGVTLGQDGRLYGAAESGSVDDAGLLFSMAVDGSDYRVLHEFVQATDGTGTSAPLALGADGALYGTTVLRGPGGEGTIFRVTPHGDFGVLHAFSLQDPLGQRPNGGVSFGPDGTLYSATIEGGHLGGGTVFSMTSIGEATLLHAFAEYSSTVTQACMPEAPPTVLPNGEIWGTTVWGGVRRAGALYTFHVKR